MNMKVDLKTFIFIYSQFYVALSRVTSAQRVTILFFKNSNSKTNNVVYPKILSQLLQA